MVNDNLIKSSDGVTKSYGLAVFAWGCTANWNSVTRRDRAQEDTGRNPVHKLSRSNKKLEPATTPLPIFFAVAVWVVGGTDGLSLTLDGTSSRQGLVAHELKLYTAPRYTICTYKYMLIPPFVSDVSLLLGSLSQISCTHHIMSASHTMHLFDTLITAVENCTIPEGLKVSCHPLRYLILNKQILKSRSCTEISSCKHAHTTNKWLNKKGINYKIMLCMRACM